MTFSKEWDLAYRANTQMSVWPWSDLVSFIMRYARPLPPRARILELGCGAGANIPFLLSLGADYSAIEGSPSIVKQLHRRFPKLKKKIVAGDFTKHIPFEGPLDLVVDRSSMTHNTTRAIEGALKMIHGKLRPGGLYIGIDWFSTKDGDARRGRPAGDVYTREKFSSGRFSSVGRVHFSDRAHLEFLFRDFDITAMEHKIVERKEPVGGTLASWNFVAVRRVGS